MKLKTKDDVYLLMDSAVPSAALGAAIETGLLWRLAARPMSAAQVAQALNIPGKRCNYWLQVLDQLGILENGPAGYAPTTLARQAILETLGQESRQYLTLEERERTAGMHNLPLYISELGSIWAAQGLEEPKNYVEKMRVNPARAREFTRMLFEVHQQLANEIVERIDMTGVERMMDLGGGSGVVSMALLRKYPALTATVVDTENVCVAGREIAEEQRLSDRISYYPADFADDEFPTGYDLVLQCDVSVFNVALFQKVWQALKPDGRFVLVGHFSPTEDYAPPTQVEWIFVDSLREPDFSVPTPEQVQTQLVQAGFEVSPESHTFGNQWIILQARKGGTSFSLSSD
jgi:cyclopropane fatty-acyl-phospholipid synthase-like methyltransferase